ncbi:MAG: hypothetical protein R3F43_27455 [bacterium]
MAEELVSPDRRQRVLRLAFQLVDGLVGLDFGLIERPRGLAAHLGAGMLSSGGRASGGGLHGGSCKASIMLCFRPHAATG